MGLLEEREERGTDFSLVDRTAHACSDSRVVRLVITPILMFLFLVTWAHELGTVWFDVVMLPRILLKDLPERRGFNVHTRKSSVFGSNELTQVEPWLGLNCRVQYIEQYKSIN